MKPESEWGPADFLADAIIEVLKGGMYMAAGIGAVIIVLLFVQKILE